MSKQWGSLHLFLIAIPSFIAVLAIRELAGLTNYPLGIFGIYGFITIGVFAILIIEMLYLSRKIK